MAFSFPPKCLFFYLLPKFFYSYLLITHNLHILEKKKHKKIYMTERKWEICGFTLKSQKRQKTEPQKDRRQYVTHISFCMFSLKVFWAPPPPIFFSIIPHFAFKSCSNHKIKCTKIHHESMSKGKWISQRCTMNKLLKNIKI